MDLLLHIGTEKTGTTSVQHWAAANRDALVRQGVWYSRVLGETNHLRIYLWALPPDTADGGFARIGANTLEERKAFQVALPGHLAAEIAEARAANCHSFLISNEHCHSRLRTPELVARLHGLLAPHFATMRIMCSLRPQIDMAVSHASSVSRGFQRVDHAYFQRVREKNLYYDYDALERRWQEVFGAEALHFTAFRRKPDTAAEMVSLLNIDGSALAPVQRYNEALDVRVMALANALGPHLERDRKSPGPILPFDILPCEETLQPGLELARDVQARFAISNAAVAARCAHIDPSDLDPDWTRYNAPSNLQILENDCAFSLQLHQVLTAANTRNTITLIRQKLAETERALAFSNTANARRFLMAAQSAFKSIPDDFPFNRNGFAAQIKSLNETLISCEQQN